MLPVFSPIYSGESQVVSVVLGAVGWGWVLSSVILYPLLLLENVRGEYMEMKQARRIQFRNANVPNIAACTQHQ